VVGCQWQFSLGNWAVLSGPRYLKIRINLLLPKNFLVWAMTNQYIFNLFITDYENIIFRLFKIMIDCL
jgi:hypothetical protein